MSYHFYLTTAWLGLLLQIALIVLISKTIDSPVVAGLLIGGITLVVLIIDLGAILLTKPYEASRPQETSPAVNFEDSPLWF